MMSCWCVLPRDLELKKRRRIESRREVMLKLVIADSLLG
jgi:hypothetical protein